MERSEMEELLKRQKAFFWTGATRPVAARKQALNKLLDTLERRERELLDALHTDLGKSVPESYMCEVGLVKSEIRYLLKHLNRYARPKRVRTPLSQFAAKSFVQPVPYGSVLILSPWNYPILLALEPLVDAIAAGNTAIVKPSAYAPRSAAVLEQVIGETFAPEYVAVVQGGRQENNALLDLDFDYIFFTGSKNVGREVMRRAAERLIPVTLELGGKSPCVVDETANIPLAAKRIVFGKLINCGQTCVAPDYIYCAESVREKLIGELVRQIHLQYGERPLENPNYGKIVNQKHFDRVCRLLNPEKTVTGGEVRPETLQIAPTVLRDVTWEDAVMQEEIFGPIFPVLTFRTLEEIVPIIRGKDTPLAMYHFSSDEEKVRWFREQIPFGGGCVNDTLIHLATSEMGFGGMGESGMGSYHGKRGFDTFTHEISLVDKKTWMDLPMRYAPYKPFYEKLVRLFLH